MPAAAASSANPPDGPLDPAVVVGLGNPGPSYAGNRHNVGAMVLEELARRCGVHLKKHKARAMAADARLGVGPGGAPGPRAVLAIPVTYMNESGGPIAALTSFYSAAPGQVIVVHDELELPFGEVKARFGGGEAGHNGLRSATSSLKTRNYLRVRVGIGRPPGRQSPGDFVLEDFRAAERKELPFLLGDAADVVEELAAQGAAALRL